MNVVLQRLLQLLPVLLLVTLGTFLMMELMPGDPAIAILGESATAEQVEAVREELRLDDPWWQRYRSWVGDMVTGDMGTSIRSDRSVWTEIVERLPVTIELALLAQVVALVLAVPIGIWSAYRAGTRFDRAVSVGAFSLISIPSFVLALLLVYVFALQLEWFPVTGWVRFSDNVGQNLRHVVLPVLSLALVEAAVYAQLLRADMLSTLQEDYMLSAKGKGMSTGYILLRHALRPSSFSLVTMAGLNLGRLIGGTVIVESLFALPGIGRLIVQSIPARDIPVVQGTVVLLAVVYLLINAAVDFVYVAIDPRTRRHASR